MNFAKLMQKFFSYSPNLRPATRKALIAFAMREDDTLDESEGELFADACIALGAVDRFTKPSQTVVIRVSYL